MGVMRLGYVHARVTDMDDALSHYCHTLGMHKVAQADGKTYLKPGTSTTTIRWCSRTVASAW